MASKHWTSRLFGEKLIKCSPNHENNYEYIETNIKLENTFNYVGVYFSFANINAQKEETTSLLLTLYEQLNSACDCNKVKKQLEIVQIVLWANNDIFGDFEASHKESIENTPWLAVPFTETDLKSKLSRRFRIKTGVPTLVLLDATGSTITVSGKERLIEDPNGDHFPWKPRPVHEVLLDVELIPGGLRSTVPGNIKYYKDLPKDAIKAFYFSANWCPPCRAFTPQLIETYKLVRKKDPHFEIVFVSSDRSLESFELYLGQMPWLAVPYHLTQVRTELAQIYGVRGIPTVLLLDGNGEVISQNARTEIQDDPEAQNYPWRPRLVNILNERFSAKLHENPAIILFIDEEFDLNLGEELLKPAANKYYSENLDEDELNLVQFLVAPDSETSDLIKDLVGLEDLEFIPLLVCIDLPNNQFVVCENSTEISSETILQFLKKYQTNLLEFKTIH